MINGGVTTDAQISEHLTQVDGVMLGREAYHHPWLMTGWDERYFGALPNSVDRDSLNRDSVEAQMVSYMARCVAHGEPWSRVSRHMLGLRNGQPGARVWRQVWSDHSLKALAPQQVSRMAAERAFSVAA